ncbi:MAG: hypothetical protein EZS28_011717 [Streblomastix strix]|uniref:Uncharacterized protein n=1 Tax=Streblomastix strix TaxID=222440 RepID=A0A5J4WCT8_9EUKA|nr:MAG: hypothetical protein EZS28_011717 [Streblomastix strix]
MEGLGGQSQQIEFMMSRILAIFLKHFGIPMGGKERSHAVEIRYIERVVVAFFIDWNEEEKGNETIFEKDLGDAERTLRCVKPIQPTEGYAFTEFKRKLVSGSIIIQVLVAKEDTEDNSLIDAGTFVTNSAPPCPLFRKGGFQLQPPPVEEDRETPQVDEGDERDSSKEKKKEKKEKKKEKEKKKDNERERRQQSAFPSSADETKTMTALNTFMDMLEEAEAEQQRRSQETSALGAAAQTSNQSSHTTSSPQNPIPSLSPTQLQLQSETGRVSVGADSKHKHHGHSHRHDRDSVEESIEGSTDRNTASYDEDAVKDGLAAFAEALQKVNMTTVVTLEDPDLLFPRNDVNLFQTGIEIIEPLRQSLAMIDEMIGGGAEIS